MSKKNLQKDLTLYKNSLHQYKFIVNNNTKHISQLNTHIDGHASKTS